MPQSLKCVAFYADCQHEVIPVKQGYRIALTYNLVLEPDLKDNVISPLKHDNPVLSQALKDYFLVGKKMMMLIMVMKHARSMLEKFDEIILNLINLNADSRINALLIQHQINAITGNNKRAYSQTSFRRNKNSS